MDGQSVQATAWVEDFEEVDLRVRPLIHFVDIKRTQCYTRYHLAKRIGGNPVNMS